MLDVCTLSYTIRDILASGHIIFIYDIAIVAQLAVLARAKNFARDQEQVITDTCSRTGDPDAKSYEMCFEEPIGFNNRQ